MGLGCFLGRGKSITLVGWEGVSQILSYPSSIFRLNRFYKGEGISDPQVNHTTNTTNMIL